MCEPRSAAISVAVPATARCMKPYGRRLRPSGQHPLTISAMTDFSIIGKPTAMIDAAEKTTGAGKYTDDLSVPGMLIGKLLHSPYPHARIKRIDTFRAE